MNVTVVCEHNASMDSEAGKRAYPEGLGVCLKEMLEEAGHRVTLVTADENGAKGLTDEIIGGTDVMFWWGHWHHLKVADEIIHKVADRALRGMGMVFLHSAHDSKMFKRLLGSSCSLKWREDGEHERLWCVDPTHPIARGLGEYIDIPEEEMYGEPFDIPTPDELVYIGWFRGGEVFRGGCVFKRGAGKLFYFNPGHETYPTYKLPAVRQILRQACEYVAPAVPLKAEICCPHIEQFSIPAETEKKA